MFGRFFRNLFIVFCLIGVAYTASCVHSCNRHFSSSEPQRGGHRLKLDTEVMPPLAENLSGRSGDKPVILTSFTPTIQADPDFDFGKDPNNRYEAEAEIDDFEYEAPPAPLLEAFCTPGLYVLDLIGFEASSTPAWWLTVLFSWAVWAIVLRIAWIVPARYFGWGYSPRAFRYWQWLGVPWRPLYPALLPVILWLRLLRVGLADTDRWAGYFERAYHTFKTGQLLLGRQSFWYLPCLQPIGLTTERGATIIAAPGSGKTNWVITQLSMYPGNFAVVDCDGGIHCAIGDHLRKQGKQVIVCDPLGLKSAGFNLLDEVLRSSRYGNDAAVEFAAVLADGLIKETYGQNSWVAADAKTYVKSLILMVCRYAKPEHRNLVYLRRLLIMGQQTGLRPQDDPFLALLASMKLKTDWDGAIASGAEMMRRSFSQSDGRSIPLSYCIEQTQWLDIPSVARMSKHSDFECLDLKAGKGVCVFLVLPLQAMSGPLAGFVRAFFTQTIYAFQRDKRHRPVQPTALMLDEAHHIHLDSKLRSLLLSGMRKYGLIANSIFQSVEQMGDAASDYMGMSEVNMFMTTNDQATLNYLSQTLGASTRTERVHGNWPFGIEPRNQQENRRLASPGQIKLLLKDHVIVTRADAAPMLLKPVKHFVELPVSWLTPSNFYGETAARAFTRRLLNFFTGRKALPPARPSIRNRKGIAS